MLAVLPQPPAAGELATRADFAAMLVKAAAIPQSPVKSRVAKDVAPDAWYAGAVATRNTGAGRPSLDYFHKFIAIICRN